VEIYDTYRERIRNQILMAIIFDDILARGVKRGQIPARSQEAREWFRQKAKETRSSQRYPNSILNSSDSKKPRVGPGRMYHFFYDPKTKATLPYYDRFPLIFMVQFTKDGFHGINLHYLPLKLRAALMDELYEISSDKKYDENTRLALSYKLLSGSSKYEAFKPCFKKYLYGHVKSKFIEIVSAEWDIALFLPTERFEKASKQTVHRESRKMLS
jgi:hypothetical protein